MYGACTDTGELSIEGYGYECRLPHELSIDLVYLCLHTLELSAALVYFLLHYVSRPNGSRKVCLGWS